MTTDGTISAVEMRVIDVWQGRQGGRQGAAVQLHLLLLEEVGGKRVLPIKMGPGEGWSIAQHLHQRAVARPMTYALMATLVRETGALLRDVTVTNLTEGTFYAAITLELPQGSRAVDARPSDAIGLALAAEIPIRADSTVLTMAGIAADPPDVLQRAHESGADLQILNRMLTTLPEGTSAAAASGVAAVAMEPVNLHFATGLEGWMLAGNLPQAYEMTRVLDTRSNGGGAASLKSKSQNPDGFGTILQWFRADAYRGTRLRLSAEVKAAGVVGSAGLWMRIDAPHQTLHFDNVPWTRVNGPSATLGFDNMLERPIKGTSDWQRYDVVLDVPAESAEIYHGLLLRGGGQVWLADVRLDAVGVDVPVTGETSE